MTQIDSRTEAADQAIRDEMPMRFMLCLDVRIHGRIRSLVWAS
jgi:hypothetical protein